MTKKQILFIACSLLVCLLSLFAVMPIQWAGIDESRWMTSLDDNTEVNGLAIPGTHDSGATHSIADLSGKCQSLTIKEQLKLGVRFFDIRLKLKDDKLIVVHSFVEQGTDFEDVLSEMCDFLKENPGEFLFVSIKEDADPTGSSLDFTEQLEKMLKAQDCVSEGRDIPKTVGEARGKMHIIARYSKSTIGFPAYSGWKDSTSFELDGIYVQDKYRVDSAEEKIEEIKSCFEVANKGEHELVINFASCYYPDGFPPTYAGTPALKINPWLIQNLSQIKPQGVILCDFITSELCKTIIRSNFK